MVGSVDGLVNAQPPLQQGQGLRMTTQGRQHPPHIVEVRGHAGFLARYMERCPVITSGAEIMSEVLTVFRTS
jgi:hypothetical protein